MSERARKIIGLAAKTGRSAVAWSFAASFLRAGAGLLVLPLMVRHLPVEHLGLWYVFLSLGLLVGLLDMGFFPSIIRAVGYLWAGAERLLPFGFAAANSDASRPAAPNHAMLATLVATMKTFYRALAGVVFLLLLFGGGWWIWWKTRGMPDAVEIRAAWCLFAFGSMLNMGGTLWPALLVGINGVRQAQQILGASFLINCAVTAVGLIAGWGLWALVAGNILMGLAIRSLGRFCFMRLAGKPLLAQQGRRDAEMIRVLWPTAWRSGLVGVGAYLVLQANTLVCSAFLGLEATASYGLSIQLALTLVTVSATWLQVKMPVFNQLRAQGRNNEIARLFAGRMRLALATYAAGGLSILFLAPAVLRWIGSNTALLPLPFLAVLLLVQLLEMHHSQYGSLVLTENRNPFVKPALISGICIVGLSLWLTPRWGLWGMLFATGLVQACYNNWWPVWRGVKGLGEAGQDYWKLFFGLLPGGQASPIAAAQNPGGPNLPRSSSIQ